MTKKEHKILQKYAEQEAWALKRLEAKDEPNETLLFAQRSLVAMFRILMAEYDYTQEEINYYCKK